MTFTISKKYLIGAVVAVMAILGLTVAGCTNGKPQPTGQQSEDAQQRADENAQAQTQPIPSIHWSQIKQTLIDSEVIAANSTQTTSFFFQMGNQDPIASCPSIGEPVAKDDQLSNPNQIVHDPYPQGGAAVPIGQEDPDGIYHGQSSGTYVICVNNAGQKYLQYWEGDVMTVTANAEWNAATHSVKVTGAPTAAIHTAPGK